MAHVKKKAPDINEKPNPINRSVRKRAPDKTEELKQIKRGRENHRIYK